MKPAEIDGIAYLTYSGSIAYGTNTETSDVDIRGFYQESISDIITGKAKDTITFSLEDTVVYSLRKFIHLCKNANPNILELLGTKDEHIIFINDVGKLIRDNRELFYSKRVFNTFGGYANSQRRKILKTRFYKDAMHLIRLYLMAIDLLEGRGLIVYRENDRGLLMSVRNAECSLETIFDMADTLEKQMQHAYDNSKLPEKPDDAAIDKLLLKAYDLRR